MLASCVDDPGSITVGGSHWAILYFCFSIVCKNYTLWEKYPTYHSINPVYRI